jgi:glycosyltransferase involved in cell wall biosynthesis
MPIVAIDARLVGGRSTGDSTYWTGLVLAFAEIRPQTRILLFSNKERPQEIPRVDGIEWICVPGGSRLWSYVRFPLAARRVRADAIHTQYTLSPLVGRNGFTTVHDLSFLIGPEWFKPIDRAILSRSVPAAVRRAKGVFAVSETGKLELERLVPASVGKTVVTFNACPPWVRAVPPNEARARVARQFGIEGPFLLTVGTWWPRKNMQLAVDATQLLAESFPHKLVVTGKEGWGGKQLSSRIKSVGYVSNESLCDLYSAAELYLAPSRYEGFGIPLLEAFRCGCPVLCSSGGALPEVAAGAAAVECSWRPEDWASRLKELLGDSSKLEHLRKEGFRREAEFSWEDTARRTLSTYFGATA